MANTLQIKSLVLKIKNSFILSFLLVSFINYSLIAQSIDAYHIKTVQITDSNNGFSDFVFPLNKTLFISFDDIQGNMKTYYYKLTHCDLDWTPSNLNESQYLEGYNEFEINQFENSFNTLNAYTHYRFQLPNENTRIIISGNYLLEILNDDDEVVCQRKLILYQPKTLTALNVTESRDLTYFNSKQLIQLEVNLKGLTVNYPDTEIKTFVFQNHDYNIKSPFLKPTFTNNNKLTYRPNTETDFYAGNEFLFFDNNEILVNNNQVATAFRDDEYFNTILFTKRSRKNNVYTFNPDINGRYRVRKANSSNPRLEADYSYVNISLKNEIDLNNKEVFVYGAFNNYQLTEENRMMPNEDNSKLEVFLFLKQGFYNYDFVIKSGEKIDKHRISGSHYATENTYEAIVYYIPFGKITYEVVGYAKGNSKTTIEN